MAAQQGVAADELVAPASPSLWRSQLNAGTLAGRMIAGKHIKAALSKAIEARDPDGFELAVAAAFQGVAADSLSVGLRPPTGARS